MDLLKMPLVLATLEIEGNDRLGEEVVTGAHGAIKVRAGVADLDVEHAQLRIDGRRLPHRSTAVLPHLVVLRPGLVPELTWSRNRVEAPDLVAGLGVVRGDVAANLVLGTGDADVDQPVVVDRRHRLGVAGPRTVNLNTPGDFAGFLIECRQFGVDLSDKDESVADRHTAIDLAAAEREADDVDVRGVLPFLLPVPGVD